MIARLLCTDCELVHGAPAPNELVSLEQEIGELEMDVSRVETPTGLSRMAWT
jgi:hypothetical protein